MESSNYFLRISIGISGLIPIAVVSPNLGPGPGKFLALSQILVLKKWSYLVPRPSELELGLG